MHFPATYVRLLESGGTPAELQVQPLPDHALVYPPVGFLPWPFGQVGNGDAYGYYWPVGREDGDPVVALMSHDYGALNPIASSIEALARLGTSREVTALLTTGELSAGEEDEEDETQAPDVANRLPLDDRSPYLLVGNADLALSQNDPGRAESLYLKAVETLPEYTAAHYGLALVYRRLRRPGEAIRWMLEAIRSPLAFRGASFWSETDLPPERVNRQDYRRKCLLWLQQARPEQAAGEADDPLFRARDRLTFVSGVATNDDYLIYEEAIEDYVRQGRPLNAVRLAMTCGELMMSETTPFRERYGFTPDGYRQRLLQLFRAANLKDRTRFLEG
jgi:tetratricopeptide (TPR) repeat protein